MASPIVLPDAIDGRIRAEAVRSFGGDANACVAAAADFYLQIQDGVRALTGQVQAAQSPSAPAGVVPPTKQAPPAIAVAPKSGSASMPAKLDIVGAVRANPGLLKFAEQAQPGVSGNLSAVQSGKLALNADAMHAIEQQLERQATPPNEDALAHAIAASDELSASLPVFASQVARIATMVAALRTGK